MMVGNESQVQRFMSLGDKGRKRDSKKETTKEMSNISLFRIL